MMYDVQLVEFWVDDVLIALKSEFKPLEYVFMWVIEMMLHRRIVLKALFRHPKVLDVLEIAIKTRVCCVCCVVCVCMYVCVCVCMCMCVCMCLCV